MAVITVIEVFSAKTRSEIALSRTAPAGRGVSSATTLYNFYIMSMILCVLLFVRLFAFCIHIHTLKTHYSDDKKTIAFVF